MIRSAAVLVLGATLLVVGAAKGGAQEVVLEGATDTRAARVLARTLAAGSYLLMDRDTVLPADFHLAQDLVIWDADVRLEGTVEGSISVIRGTLALRPGSRVTGPIASLEGIVLVSGLAEAGEVVELPASRWVRARREDGVLRVGISGPPAVPRLGLSGLAGVRRVSYDRVDGLSVSAGPEWRITGREFGPLASGWVTLRSARGRVGGGVSLRLPLGEPTELVLSAERETRSNEGWIRGDLANSVEALLAGRDVRDHYESERVLVRLARGAAPLTVERTLRFSPYLEVGRSWDRSLDALGPWSLRGREQMNRPNLAVREAELTTGEIGTRLDWLGRSTRFSGLASAEHGRIDGGDTRFLRWLADGRWEMDALWGHTLTVDGHAFAPIGDNPAPPQRWSFVGGQGTIPTLPVAALRGDRLAMVRTGYRVPVTPIELPFLGSPALELLHSTGTSWRTGTPMPDWEQNLGVGIALTAVRARAWIDPSISRPRPTWLIEAGLR
jgi:hypothetical protein